MSTPSRPPGRRAVERRPWPTAPTTTRPSPRRTPSTRPRSTTPTPSTVWLAGPRPIPLDEAWPTALVRHVVTSFSQPGEHVVLLTATSAQPQPEAALTAAEDLDRIGRIESATTGEAPSPDAALVVFSFRPGADRDVLDRALRRAAHLLRVAGALVVLTHCDWTSGELDDPTGAVVAAGQNLDLLYLQHIVALHAPVRNGRLQPLPAPDTPDDGAHQRVHSDVLVFVQPRDHQATGSTR